MGGAPVRRHRLLRAPAPGVVARQLRRHGVEVVGVQLLEGVRQAAVQQPAGGRAGQRVGRLAQEIVREVVAGRRLADDAAAPELVEGPDDGLGVELAGLDEQGEGELRARRRQRGRRRRGRWGSPPPSGRAASPRGPPAPAPAVPRDVALTASTTCSGSPPVTACSASGSSGGRPPDRRGQPGGAGGVERVQRELRGRDPGGPHPREPSVGRPRFVAGGARRSAAARRRPGPRRWARKARVSWSPHWRLSRTSSRGRPTGRNACARPSENRWRRHASAMARAAVDEARVRPAGARGTSRSTSRRQTGSRASTAACTAGTRSQSATGASASRSEVP